MLYVGHNVAADMDFCLIIQSAFRQPNTYHPREKTYMRGVNCNYLYSPQSFLKFTNHNTKKKIMIGWFY